MTDAETARKHAMWARYGRPEMLNPDDLVVLNAVASLPHDAPFTWDDVRASRVLAFRYRDEQAAAAFAASNLEHQGHPSLGAWPTPDGDGVVGFLDLRPALARMREEREARQP